MEWFGGRSHRRHEDEQMLRGCRHRDPVWRSKFRSRGYDKLVRYTVTTYIVSTSHLATHLDRGEIIEAVIRVLTSEIFERYEFVVTLSANLFNAVVVYLHARLLSLPYELRR
jgi:hypothetical protein